MTAWPDRNRARSGGSAGRTEREAPDRGEADEEEEDAATVELSALDDVLSALKGPDGGAADKSGTVASGMPDISMPIPLLVSTPVGDKPKVLPAITRSSCP